ncbi:unnamed protein product [Diatraea saccharalis]|uniref:Cubilin n=1 Tax=Diatraea saccharalis TaxID=40085 RepID=A0A9N9RCM4_9NEOP|nr:unnamed protein product [Diatraea saccharalis]
MASVTVEQKSKPRVLSSPNHPNHYDNDLDYWVHIIGPPDTRLVIIFHKIELEYQKDCLYDYIELRDPSNMKSSRYCGSVGVTKWVAADRRAVLHFHSDYNNQGAGFSLSWHAVELTGCPSQTFTSKEGTIRSPNYPNFLLPNLDCTIDILAPAGKRVFLNISSFDFGYGTFKNGVPFNFSNDIPEYSFLEVQIDLQTMPIRPFVDPNILTNGLFVSQSEILRLRLKTGENVTGMGFLAHFKTVGFLNVSHVVEVWAGGGQLAPPNWPGAAPARASLSTRLLALPRHTLALALHRAALPPDDRPHHASPCGPGHGWIQVKDSYADNNGTEWILCDSNRSKRKVESSAPLVINSYLHVLTVTQHADPEYHNKLLLLPDETNLESCYPNPCMHGGHCVSDDTKAICRCAGYYTGIFCSLTACERSPCVFGNCSLVASGEGSGSGSGFTCACARGWRGVRCAERVRACAARPCNNRGACTERDGGFLCQCNPSWKGKRCEIPNPTPNIVGLGTRMLQEPFWLGLFAVFTVLGMVGLVWCAKRHFPEKIEKLLAEEADRCARRKFFLDL